jgi:hypothetical protein
MIFHFPKSSPASVPRFPGGKNYKYYVVYIYITSMKQKSEILHYPQLDTVLMVEEFIKENSGEFKKRKLWEHLPRRMMYQTFCVIFDYLFESNKIAIDRDGTVGWIWDPEGVKKYLKRRDLWIQ